MLYTKETFCSCYREQFAVRTGVAVGEGRPEEHYRVLAEMIADEARAIRSRRKTAGKKHVYYFSMEFLVGRLLESALLALGIRETVEQGLAEMGISLSDLLECEPDPGLGNGGLGRLAACCLDSMASVGIYGTGNGIRYRFGLFEQKIVNGCQTERPDRWLDTPYPWEERIDRDAVRVKFGGRVVRHSAGEHYWFSWEDAEEVLAVPYEVPVIGADGKTVNTLCLWSAEPAFPDFDMEAFNAGRYSDAMRYRAEAEAMVSVLYPNDSSDAGKRMRIRQEYLFVAGGISRIVRRFKQQYGSDWKQFPERVSIHINDTHPALCAPELMRLLVDEEGVPFEEAWEITVRSITYTNHTILPEALEQWPAAMVKSLLPRPYMLIEEIDRRYLEQFPRTGENWPEQLKNTAILWDGQVRMANLSVIAGRYVNGVAELHSAILRERVLHDFYLLAPDKFGCVTNGVSHRRFLIQANPALTALIDSAIGPEWRRIPEKLEELRAFSEDSAFLERLAAVKRENKVRLGAYIRAQSGMVINPDSMFDLQVKRFHAYKRQLLGVFKVMHLYHCLLEGQYSDSAPCTFLFAGKAAQGYSFAKSVIHLVNAVAERINRDPRAKGRMQVVFVENFGVSNAQLLYPAAEVSEQISTAGYEASGTGNMKFMFNGAVTLGTWDGANIEIAHRAGEKNAFLFGMTADEVQTLRRCGSYLSWDVCRADSRLQTLIDALTDGSFGRSVDFEEIRDALLRGNDEYFVLREFDAYLKRWQEVDAAWREEKRWQRMSLQNIAAAGYFSSDRAVVDYARKVWRLPEWQEEMI